MKTLKTLISYILLLTLLSSCRNETKQNTKEEIKEEYKGGIEIVKVRSCDYVLWHNGYGSDMEHYEGCKNTEHYN